MQTEQENRFKNIIRRIEPTNGAVIIPSGKRMAVLKQDQFAFDEKRVLDTVLMGYAELYTL